MDQKKLEKLKLARFRDIRMFRMIEVGHRSQTGIAKKLGLNKQYVDYYFKVLKIK